MTFPLPPGAALPIGEPTELVHDTQHVLEALSRLPMQFQEKPRIAALISALVTQCQDIEDTAWDLYVDRTVDTAVGAQQDILGHIVGAPRDGRSDSDYRFRLKLQIAVNRSDGGTETMNRIMRLIVLTNDFTMSEVFPAGLNIEIVSHFFGDPVDTGKLLKKAVTAGVHLAFIYNPSGFAFAFSDTGSPVNDVGHGLGTTTDSGVGGNLTGVI